MLLISEEKQGRLSIYYKNVINDDTGEIISKRRVKIPLHIEEVDGFTYYVLYDDEMEVIHDAFVYLNDDMRNMSINTRKQAANALRLLYCYLALTNTDIENLTDKSVSELVYFLRGMNNAPEKYKLLTSRSANTVNVYLATYRTYFKKKGIDSEALFRSKNVKVESTYDGYTSTKVITKYDSNVKTKKAEQYVPKFISLEEFERIYRLAKNKGDIQTVLIISLMYTLGLRLGEVLGLTLEDVKQKRVNDEIVPILALRNRVSDKDFQCAKGRLHVRNQHDYITRDYKADAYEMTITRGIQHKIIEYVNTIHQYFLDHAPEEYEKGVADSVEKDSEYEENHYIFLNTTGRPLSAQSWNKRLKRYFIEADIPIDQDVKRNSLSHRFRHGFAMFHVLNPRIDENGIEHRIGALELKKLMRHNTITSTMVYFNPTPQQEAAIKEDFLKHCYETIPELKGDFNVSESE